MKIVLAYRHVEGDLSTGDVTIHSDKEGEDDLSWSVFTGAAWKVIMTAFARALVAYPAVTEAYIQRTDRPGLVALRVEGPLLALLRTDPIEAMRQLTVPDQVIVLRDTKPVMENIMPPLRAAQDTLAQCFSDVVYIRARGADVECAVCGHWVTSGGKHLHYNCRSCNNTVHLSNRHSLENWRGVDVEYLLAHTNSKRFYLPRAWNPHGKWITRGQLVEMQQQYNQDKEQAS